MRISVVTPNFNMASYLEDTITSVIGNLRSGDEYFVIDWRLDGRQRRCDSPP
jgi:glycosyltransferase involved in cell wall biosynthesis